MVISKRYREAAGIVKCSEFLERTLKEVACLALGGKARKVVDVTQAPLSEYRQDHQGYYRHYKGRKNNVCACGFRSALSLLLLLLVRRS